MDTTETDKGPIAGNTSDNSDSGESSAGRESSDGERRKSYNVRPRKQGALWRKGSTGGQDKRGFGTVKVETDSQTEGSGSESEESAQESESPRESGEHVALDVWSIEGGR